MLTSLPNDFLDKCSSEERSQVEQWWRSLQEENRDDIRVLLDRRHESIAYVYTKDEQGTFDWHEIPFTDDQLPKEDFDAYEEEWKLDYFHHLLDHPSWLLGQDVVVRTFVICSRHLSAIDAHEKGWIDSSFRCSDFNPACPILKFMAGFDAAQLVGYTTHSRRSAWLCKRKDVTEPNDARMSPVNRDFNE